MYIMKGEREKKIAASVSIFSNAVIIILKLVAGVISQSMSIISEALHSMSDFLASVLTYFAILCSSEPADKEHPFGHGRYEDVAGFVEGILILLASFYIIFESCKKIIFNSYSDFNSNLGIMVMFFAIVLNVAVSSYLAFVAKKTNSIALEADSKHLSSDVYSTLGVLLGLVLIKITKISLLDPLIAIFVALIILKTGMSIIKKTMNNLVDGTLPDEDIAVIDGILKDCCDIYGYKNFKSRKIGANRDIDITILCDENFSLKKCHSICDEIEDKIKEAFPNTLITIHCEPYEDSCF